MMTLTELQHRFPTEDSCREYLVAQRWPNGVRCPRCGNDRVYDVARPWNWQCNACAPTGYRFSPLVGTVFENTNVGLRDWFQVIYLMCQSKKGISSLQVQRMMGFGSYKTAWYMCHRIRAAMQSPEFKKLSGFVEVDETYVGGKAKNRHGGGVGGGKKKGQGGRGMSGKVAVIGAIARKGNVVCRVIENTKQKTLEGFVKEAVSEEVSLVSTDEAGGYKRLYKSWPHESVDHSHGEYVRGNVHTANIDSFWSGLKRGIVGTFHKVSKRYLPLYLNEFSFRYNNRKDGDMFALVVAGS